MCQYNSQKEAEKGLEEAMESSGYMRYTHWRIERHDITIVDERIVHTPIDEDKLLELLQVDNLFLHGNTAYRLESINLFRKEFTLRNYTGCIDFKFKCVRMVNGELKAEDRQYGSTYSFKVFRPVEKI
jgi:hypothetical protein